MDAVTLLKTQHREVEALFAKIERTSGAVTRRKLMDAIARALKVHTSIEEEIFYPAVRALETKKITAMIMEAYEEHHVVDLVLAELPKVDPEAAEFEAKMTVLKELIEHHVEEEEQEMFKTARKLGKDRLRELGDAMAAAADEYEEPRRARAS